MAQVEINGNRYVLAQDPRTKKPIFKSTYVERLSSSFRTIGVQQRSDDASVNRFIFRGFPLGFGYARIDRMKMRVSPLTFDPMEGIGGFLDSTCDTRWSRITLPLRAVASTDVATHVLRASCSFGGNLWALWENSTTGANGKSRKYVGSTTTWTAGGTVIDVARQMIFRDIMAYKTGMNTLFVDSDKLFYEASSTDGVTWSVARSVPSVGGLALSNAPTADQDIDAGLLAESLGEKVAIVYDQATGTIAFCSGTTLTGAWTNETVTIPSGNGPQGVAIYPGIDNVSKMLVGTREALYEVDTAPATWTIQKVLEVPPSSNNFRRMTVHQGKLWFALGVDDNSPAPIYTMQVNGRERIFNTEMGLDKGDGVVAEMLGPVRWMKSAGRFLFAAVGGGAASRNARVICHNGTGWHHMTRNGTANQKIEWIDVSADDDGTPRLHWGVRTATNTTATSYEAQPLVSPTSGVSLQYETSGYLRIPTDDLLDPQTIATVYQGLVDADDLTADTTGEYIRHQYGVDGAADTTTDLTNYLSGTKTLSFGASSQGVAARVIANRLTFNRGTTNTNTPKLREFEIQASNRFLVNGRTAWDFTVDIERTAQEAAPTVAANTHAQETIITNLRAIAESTTMVTFTVGEAAQIRVQVPVIQPPIFDLEVVNSEGGNLGYQTGTCTMRLEKGI